MKGEKGKKIEEKKTGQNRRKSEKENRKKQKKKETEPQMSQPFGRHIHHRQQ